MGSIPPVPAGYHTVTPYLIIKDAAGAIEFYQRAFEATELMRIHGPGNTVGHAEIRVGDSPVMLSEEMTGMSTGPQTLGGTPVSLMIYVPDVDAVFKRAIAAGATEMRPVEDQFYGDRMGSLKDPYGHIWHIATHVKDVPLDEMQRKATEMYG